MHPTQVRTANNRKIVGGGGGAGSGKLWCERIWPRHNAMSCLLRTNVKLSISCKYIQVTPHAINSNEFSRCKCCCKLILNKNCPTFYFSRLCISHFKFKDILNFLFILRLDKKLQKNMNMWKTSVKCWQISNETTSIHQKVLGMVDSMLMNQQEILMYGHHPHL